MLSLRQQVENRFRFFRILRKGACEETGPTGATVYRFMILELKMMEQH